MKSEEAFHGDALAQAPDIVPMLADNRYYLDTGLFSSVAFEDCREFPRGLHHMDGIGLVVTPGVRAGGTLRGSIMDVMPSLLHFAGLDVPAGLDGSVLTDALTVEQLKASPVRVCEAAVPGPRDEVSPFSPEDEEAIECRLRGLGYL